MEIRLLAFVTLMAFVAAAIPWAASQARRRGAEGVGRALQELAVRGFAAEQATSPQGRTVVRVWGTLAHPVAFDLAVKRRSRLSRVVGGQSPGMLDPAFESAFAITSREPERARSILAPEIQRGLLAARGAELCLGSFESLLPREYAVAAGLGEGRRLRRLWMIRVPGTLARLGDPSPLAELGRGLAAAVEKHALPPATPDHAPYETGSAESWI